MTRMKRTCPALFDGISGTRGFSKFSEVCSVLLVFIATAAQINVHVYIFSNFTLVILVIGYLKVLSVSLDRALHQCDLFIVILQFTRS